MSNDLVVDLPSTDNIPYLYKIFDCERSFFNVTHITEVNEWMRLNWYNSIFYGLLYVVLIFVGQNLMQHRQPLNIQPILIFWNLCLAVFSWIGFMRVLPEFQYSLFTKGFEYSICNNSNGYGVSGFWSYMFCLSKVPELFDTLFIVLRKRPLIFLHWFHHSTVLVYTWFAYENLVASGRWFMTINYGIHAFMYTYYTCKALKLKVPQFCSIMITVAQIIQMFIGCYININVFLVKKAGRHCRVTSTNVCVSLLMYLIYFILFTQYFVSRYLSRSKQKLLSSKKSDDPIVLRKDIFSTKSEANSLPNKGEINGIVDHSTQHRQNMDSTDIFENIPKSTCSEPLDSVDSVKPILDSNTIKQENLRKRKS